MWKLMKTNSAREWVQDGAFATLREAGNRIQELEGTEKPGLFFEVHVLADFGTDDETLGHLEFTGQQALYVVKRQLQ